MAPPVAPMAPPRMSRTNISSTFGIAHIPHPPAWAFNSPLASMGASFSTNWIEETISTPKQTPARIPQQTAIKTEFRPVSLASAQLPRFKSKKGNPVAGESHRPPVLPHNEQRSPGPAK